MHAPTLPPETLFVFDTVPDLYLILAPDLTILTASDAYLKATLKEREKIKGKHLFEVFPDNPDLSDSDAIANLRYSLEWVLQHRQPHQMELQRYDVTEPLESGSFKEKYWLPSNTPVLDAQGSVWYIIHKVEDVTEHVQDRRMAARSEEQVKNLTRQQLKSNIELIAAHAEAELQKENLHNILMQAPALICLFEGPRHVFKLVNPHYQRLVGDRPIEGKPIAEVMPELEGQPIFGLLDKVYQTGETFYAHEMKVQLDHDNSGSLGHNYYNFIYQPTRNYSGQINGIMVFAYEVTEMVKARLEAEDREQALQALNEQMAAANEEIRASNEELSITQLALQDLNEELEARVEERTRELRLAQQEIEGQRNRLQKLFMQASTPICILDGPNFVYELVNPAYQQLLPGRRLLGNSLLSEALAELETHPFAEILRQVYQTGKPFETKEGLIPVARYEGGPPEDRYFNYTLQPRLNEEGVVDGIIIFAFEVTEQVEARQLVERSAKRLKLITDALPVLIGYLDHEEKYRFANKAYESWFNQDPELLLGRPVREIVGEKAYAGVKQYIDRALAGERLDFESRMPYREDFVKHIRTSYVPDMKDGKVAGFFTLITDVTEQVAARQQIEVREKEAKELARDLLLANEDLLRSNAAFQQLNQEQQKLVALVENSIDFIGLATPGGKGVYINQAGLDLVGLKKEQVKEVEVLDFFDEEDKAFARDEILPTLLKEGQWVGEIRFRHFQTGASLPVHYNCFTIKDPATGEPIGLATITIDISERKKHEAELQALTEKLAATNQELSTINKQLTRTNIDLDNFIYAASHDLKAPIFNIEGLLQILIESLPANSDASEELDEVTEMIKHSIERFKRTIDHLTEVTKLQKENNQDAIEVNLSEVIQEVTLDLSPQLSEAGAELKVELNGCSGINFSEKNLRSVIYNLLSNAIKYRSPERAPKVQLYCHLEGEFAVMSVKDNGLGINLNGSQKLFSMFGRLHDHVEGSGVGLYMVKKIVENAGGRIEVDSTEGVGSTFTVYFKSGSAKSE